MTVDKRSDTLYEQIVIVPETVEARDRHRLVLSIERSRGKVVSCRQKASNKRIAFLAQAFH